MRTPYQKIDPPGFVLENFDPVGRWRDFYPVYVKQGDKLITKEGQPVDAIGTIPDGSEFSDVTDLKRYFIKNIDLFFRAASLTSCSPTPLNAP